MLVLDLIHNVALLLALTVVYDFLASKLIYSSLRHRVLAGILFGGVAVVGMLTPVQFAAGVIYDGRSIVLSVAGYIGGPLIAGIAGVIAAAYRGYLGGPGALPGLLVIVTSAGIGAICHNLRSRSEKWEGVFLLWLFGLVVHVLMMGFQLLLPRPMGFEVLRSVGPTVVIFYPPVQILIIKLFLGREKRRLTQHALAESEERYRRLFENTYAPMLIVHPSDGSILDVNEAAAEFYGWSREELTSMRVSDINTLSEDEVQREMERARRFENNYFEFRHRRRDGSERDVAVFSGSVVLENEEVLYSIVRDITGQREMEKQLYLVGYSMEHAAVGIFRIDEPDGNILYANREACEKLGYSKEELTSKTIFDIDPTFTPELWRAHRNEVRTRGSKTMETIHRRKDGTEYPVEVTVSNLSYGGENFSFSFVKDIASRKKAEEELKQSLAQKEELLREVHHRVKNNLAVINSLIHLQTDELPEDERMRKALYKTRDRIMVMGMIHNMLYHKQYVSRIRLDEFMRRLAIQLHEMYASASLVTLSFDLSEFYVDVGEAVPLGLILNEVVTNALTHAFPDEREGEVSVFLRPEAGRADGVRPAGSQPEAKGGYTISVCDNGVGLPEGFSYEDQNSLGFQLIRVLSQQIDVKISVHAPVRDDGGFCGEEKDRDGYGSRRPGGTEVDIICKRPKPV